MKNNGKRKVNCFICMDSGIVKYTQKADGKTYDYIAHCTCQAGNSYRYEGNKYYIPCIADVINVEEIEKFNRNKYKGATL